ncbi:MAG: extensin family protein [Myxococcales bacterium]|nr:extensin family protein [Myxococcales bacterium]
MKARSYLRGLALGSLLLAGCSTRALDDAGTGGGGSGGQGSGDTGTAPPFTGHYQGGGDFNVGFIGGPCLTNTDCAYDGGYCLTEAEGFPGGMCTLDCAQYCPDQAGATTTFCAEPADLGTAATDGLCTMRCNFGAADTGCRPGYQCHAIGRNDEPSTVVYACVPGEDSPYQPTACEQELAARGIAWSPSLYATDHPVDHPELDCTIDNPVWIEPVLHGVPFRGSTLDNEPAWLFTACPHALAVDDAAAHAASLGVTDIVHYGIYNCRVIAGTATLSEHGHANAIDFAGFATAGSTYYSVLDAWEDDQPSPVTPGGALLKSFATGVFDASIFNIVLTPDYNAAHDNHFHCDLTPGSHFMK